MLNFVNFNSGYGCGNTGNYGICNFMNSINHKNSVTFSRNILRANVCKISAKIVKLVIEISLFLALCFHLKYGVVWSPMVCILYGSIYFSLAQDG